MFEYTVKRVKRKSFLATVRRDASVEIRVPLGANSIEIDEFIEKKSVWIGRAREKMLQQSLHATIPDEVELLAKAREVIPKKVELYGNLLAIKPKSITINSAKTRLSSSSGKGALNFSWRLMKERERVIDYVIIHELLHLVERTHTREFWERIRAIMPDYLRIQEELGERDVN